MLTPVWIADAGVEVHLTVSLASLRHNAPGFWAESDKVVLDCGMSPRLSAHLANLGHERLHVIEHLVPPCDAVAGGDTRGGVGVMRARIDLPHLIATGALPRLRADAFLVCDPDTVFLSSPADCPLPPQGYDVSVLPEWDATAGHEAPMRVGRASTFSGGAFVPGSGRALGFEDSSFAALPTYNAGVLAFRHSSDFTSAWAIEYDRLRGACDETGHPIFASFTAEQTALAIAIARGTIRPFPLPRIYNHFPPRPPEEWPSTTVLAHFISFSRNHAEQRYALWFDEARRARESAIVLPPWIDLTAALHRER